MGSILGNRVRRVEDPRFLTAGGAYVDDIAFDGVAHVAYVRSPFAHATIESVDLDDALAVPGVVRMFTAADLTGLAPVPARPGYPAAMGQVVLAADRVRYVGQPVVAIVAETQAAALDAVDLVIVDYEPLPVVMTPEASATNETLLYPEAGTNAVVEVTSDGSADFSACEVVVEERIVNQRLSGAPMEARVGAAYWTADGRLVHYSACQGAHPTRDLLATMFGLELDRVRVVVPDMGGGFGVKSRTYPEEAALGFYARELGRPVKWTETRSENFLAMPQGRGQVQYAKLGGTRDGRITAYQLDVFQDAGAVPMTGAVLHGMTRAMACGVYDIADVGFTGTSWVTNTASITAYRGAGRPEAAVAIERMVDRFAAEIGMDPGRGPPSQHDPRVPAAGDHRHRYAVRRRRLPPIARTRARRSRLRRPSRRAGGAAGGRRSGAARHRHRDLCGDHLRDHGLGVRSGRTAARRPSAGPIGSDAIRPGPRHHLGDDRRRPDGRPDRSDRGGARRHRRDPVRRADRRVAVGAARRFGARGSQCEARRRRPSARGGPARSRAPTMSCSTRRPARSTLQGRPPAR